ncbi:precorrin-2 dehydrogenase [Paenibacillus baekrokdamisoli]|uniref:precorrin-2 dehydrogenase n=2 Tax=Paenibacillus baekrokdamisoli TaxID=1712516 RepID=A0A3G9J838_9BACL|nr:precorrin-2 dehydrogenase [Paenibacillus baekrokdamisoli]
MSGYYPLMVNLVGRRCVVIGGGKIAERKVNGLLESGANDVLVVALEASGGILELSAKGSIRLEQRAYKEEDLVDAFLVFAATNVRQINQSVASHGARLGLLVNVADKAEEGVFISPSTLRRGGLLLTVTTGGASPALTAQIKQELAKQYGEDYAQKVEMLGLLRERMLLRGSFDSFRHEVLRKAAEQLAGNNIDVEVDTFSPSQLEAYIDQWMIQLQQNVDRRQR